MSYSQTKLMELMKEGSVPGENGVPRHIETVISNVFLFEDTVYKFYKNDNDFFNKNFSDISTKEARFEFARKDFAWNNALSPTIYLRLVGASVVNDNIVFSEPSDESEELVIIMNRINSDDVLYEKLVRGEISTEDGYQIGKKFAEGIARVRTDRPTGNYFEIFGDHLEDLRNWISSVSEHIPEDEWRRYCEFLEQFRANNKERYETEWSEQLAHSGDVHSQNMVYADGELFFMDTYAPKKEWRAMHEFVSFYRLGADLWALGSEEVFEAFVKGYEEGSGTSIDRALDGPYILYSSTIMASYLYMLQRTDSEKRDAAKRYHEFIRNYFASIDRKDAI